MNPASNPLNLRLPEVPPPISTTDEAIAWTRELVQHLIKAREELDAGGTLNERKKSEARLFVRLGQLLGVLMALFRTGKLAEGAYVQLWRMVKRLEPTLLKEEPRIPPVLASDSEALAWIVALVSETIKKRGNLNVVIPQNVAATVREQRKAAGKFYLAHGSALGTLMALFRTSKIGTVAYTKMREDIIQALSPSVVGFIQRKTPSTWLR